MWQSKFSQRVVIHFTILVSTVIISPCTKGSTIFSDEVFNIADWQLVTEEEGNGGSLSFSQEPTGGNTDEYMRITLTVNVAPPYSVVFGAFFHTSATYDPQTQGEIVTLEYREDSIMFYGFGDGQHSGLVLRQNGVIYYANFPDPGIGLIQANQSLWTCQSFTSLRAEDFGRPNTLGGPYTPDAHPDFSSGGEPIEFGFYRADTTPSFSYSIVAGIDNWFVAINPPSITPHNDDIPWLQVDGNRIKDPNGNVVVLRGISLIDIGLLEDNEPNGTINMINRITDKNDSQGNSPGWYPKVIRIPIYPHRWIPSNYSYYIDLLRRVVDHCAQKGLYVIIDWHCIANTWENLDQTKEFWKRIAPEFSNDSHVLFEVFNEPKNDLLLDTLSWLYVKRDMEIWVDLIRKHASENLILVGGPKYSQIIGPAATFPVSGNNIVYVSHIYPHHWLGNEAEQLKEQIETCARVHPVIMTEWGFSMSYVVPDDPVRPDDPVLPDDFFHGTITSYGQELMKFIENLKIGNTAWCASFDWGPPMFWDPQINSGEWKLRNDDNGGEMGFFVKDTLYKLRNYEKKNYANYVVDSLITASLQDPLEWCLGVPDGWSIALGDGGWIVLDMGLGEAIVDGNGADLVVHEDPLSFWSESEGYAVYGSNGANDPWVLIGTGVGTQEFDLAGQSGLAMSRYIKVWDDDAWPWTWPWEGFDLDAVEALNIE